MLDLDFAGLRFSETVHVFLRIGKAFATAHDRAAILQSVDDWLADDPELRRATLSVGGDTLSVAAITMGDIARMGLMLAGSRRAEFPRRAELLRLKVAAIQTSLACREVRELNDRKVPADTRMEKPTGEALAESEWRLNLIINTIPAMAWSATADGMLDFCNQHFLDFVGLPSDEIMGLGFYRIFHPDDTPRLLSAWQEIMASKHTREVDGRIRRADGEYRWFTLRQNPLLDPNGNVVKWYGVVLEIEDRKRAEDALKGARLALLASEQNLRLIIDSLPVLAWVARPDGSAEFVNQRWADYAGVEAEQILEWGFLDFYHPDDVEGMVAIWKDCLETKDRMGLRGRIRRFDGEYRWFYFSGQKITDANGVVRWVGANVDFEDLQRAEKLRQSQSELARVARLTTLGELAVSIAHEVNQPLMAIVTNAGTCLRWLDETRFDAARARQAAERVVRDGHRAGEIVAGIRALARKAPIRTEPMDLHDAIRDVLQVLNGEFRRRGLDASFEAEPQPLLVLGDRTQLQQVLLNMVMNSVEAMAEADAVGGRLTIRSTAGEDGFARVSVLDTGPGINGDCMDRIFEAFFSTKSGGIGMGLPICRSIVEAHGGSISASNNSPRGSIFSFTVPLAKEAA